MVMVSAIALMADVSVGRQCQLLIQHEGEDTQRQGVDEPCPSIGCSTYHSRAQGTASAP